MIILANVNLDSKERIVKPISMNANHLLAKTKEFVWMASIIILANVNLDSKERIVKPISYSSVMPMPPCICTAS